MKVDSGPKAAQIWPGHATPRASSHHTEVYLSGQRDPYTGNPGEDSGRLQELLILLGVLNRSATLGF